MFSACVTNSFADALWLDVQALLAMDGAKVLVVLQMGLQSTEHAEFVSRLEADYKSKP